MLTDLRYALRRLRRDPGFTSVAVLTLGLGIGANAAIFAFVNALYLRPPSVDEPAQLVRLYGIEAGRSALSAMSFPNYRDLRDGGNTLVDLAAHQYAPVDLAIDDTTRPAVAELVSGNYFALLGLTPLLGRLLTPEDDRVAGAHPVAVLSHRAWATRFGRDAGIVGRAVRVNGHPFTVVGVAPASFGGSFEAHPADLWAPLLMYEQVRDRGIPISHRGWGWLWATGRLRAGVTIAQARADLSAVAARIGQGARSPGFDVAIRSAGATPDDLRQELDRIISLFAASAGLVLLVACANLAGLLLVRVSTRQREAAIRLSLGAGPARLLRQWLTESAVLAALAAGAGLLLSTWLAEGVLGILRPPEWIRLDPSLVPDGRALAFTTLVTLVTAMLVGLGPAWRARRTDIVTGLKDEPTSAAGGGRPSGLHAGFVVTQVAVSVGLLVTAGLLARSLHAARTFDVGFDTADLLVAEIAAPRRGVDEARMREVYGRLLDAVRTLPGVRQATLGLVVPLGPARESRRLRIPDYQPPDGEPAVSVAFNAVGPDYFATLSIPIVRGRAFEARDFQAGAAPAAIVNETMARQFWHGVDPIGRAIHLDETGPLVEVIGIARDVKYYAIAEDPQPYVYMPYTGAQVGGLTLHLRAAPAAGAPGAIRALAARVDPGFTLGSAMTFAELRQVPLFATRAAAAVSSVFGLLALVLTTIGLYGLVAYSVAQRTREIGVRIALGASPSAIVRLVLRRALALTLAGVTAGAALSAVTTRLLDAWLFGVAAADPLTFAASAALVGGVAWLASYLPARRALAVDPIEALRAE